METITRERFGAECIGVTPKDVGSIATEAYVGVSYAGEQPEPIRPNPEPTEMISIPLPPIHNS